MISFLDVFYFIIVVSYTPFGLMQMYLVLSNGFIRNRHGRRYKKLGKKNNVLVVIVTNGKATDVVQSIISIINGYELDIKQYVIKEENDTFKYNCDEIVVPTAYTTKNRSRNKMRALQYGIEWLHEKGYEKETYICHLDDDSVVTKRYLEYLINHMSGEGGQGSIRLREFGHHTFSSFSDIVRISNCEAWCVHYNSINKPKFVHGEGLAVRADIEYEIGWDFGTYGAEDLMMGLSISKNYTFTYIPEGYINIAPPTSAKDYYRQRRRWFWSIFKNEGRIAELSLGTYLFYVYLYVVGVTGLIGFLILPYSIIFHPSLVTVLTPFWIINIICFFAYYQFGGMHLGSKKHSLKLLILQYPIAFYDGLTIIYALLIHPNFNTFETIKKV